MNGIFHIFDMFEQRETLLLEVKIQSCLFSVEKSNTIQKELHLQSDYCRILIIV